MNSTRGVSVFKLSVSSLKNGQVISYSKRMSKEKVEQNPNRSLS